MNAKRNTRQKEIIKKALCLCDSHFTAEDVCNKVAEIDTDIGRATVYRYLKEMNDTGELRQFDIKGLPTVFDVTLKNHYHIKCVKCGKVFDAKMEYIENLADNITDSEGFKILSHNIVFEGICPRCNKNK